MGAIGVVGASGLIGSAITKALVADRQRAVGIPAPRLRLPAGSAAHAAARTLSPSSDLVDALRSFEAVILAAGLAKPDSSDSGALYGANAAMPLLVLKAAELAGVAHFVHVSSAAVQGRRDPLDESAATAPFSEYSRSKALGEQLLAEHQSPIALTLYRPTSVMASGRGITRALLMATQLPVIPLIGAGDRPLPVAHLDNVAAAVVHLVRTRRTGIALHPWEGFDLRTLLIALGGDQRRFVHLPQALGRVTEVAVRTPSARLRAIGRRFELLVHGQGQQARVLVDAGFVGPCGREEYARLAESAGLRWRRSSPI